MEDLIKIIQCEFFSLHIRIKIAICDRFRGACIVESSANPSPVIGKMDRFGVYNLDKNLDPDECSYLVWMEKEIEDIVIVLFACSDWLGELIGLNLLDVPGRWDSEMEAYLKMGIFEKISRELLPKESFRLKEMETTVQILPWFPSITIMVTETCPVPKEDKKKTVGICLKNKSGIKIWVSAAQWVQPERRLIILFHEVTHLKKRILRYMGMYDEEFALSPKASAMLMYSVFENIYKSIS